MSKALKKDYKIFADEYIETGKPRESALKARPHLKPESASVHASRMLKNANVQAYIQSHAETAVTNIAKIANSGLHDSVTLRANQDILDRAGYKADTDRNPSNTPVNTLDKQTHINELIEAIKSGDTVMLERIVLGSNKEE